MKKRLSILLLSICLAAATGCSKDLAATDNLKLNTIQTNESTIKETKGTENKQQTSESNTSSTGTSNASSTNSTNKNSNTSSTPNVNKNPSTSNINSATKDSVAVSSSKNISTIGAFLVNRSNRLEKNYIPQSLRIPNVKFISYADPKVKKMDTSAAAALESLFNAAKANGVTLLAVSGYRDYSYQQTLYNNKVSAAGRNEADKYVAQPGASEHQTGLAMDVLSDKYTSLDDGFDKTQAYKWLESNCYKYGFIIRYPKGKESITGYNYEPWHIRYVGISEATEISQKHITLEEYLNKVG